MARYFFDFWGVERSPQRLLNALANERGFAAWYLRLRRLLQSSSAVRSLRLCVVRRGRADEFLEARIIPKRIEHRIEPEQRGSERHVCSQCALRTVSRVVSVKRRWRGRVLPSAPLPGRGSRSDRDHPPRLSRSGSRPWPARPELNAAALSPRPILVSARSPMRLIIFRLFFEERFQFAARLSPTFLGGGMVAGDFLRPA